MNLIDNISTFSNDKLNLQELSNKMNLTTKGVLKMRPMKQCLKGYSILDRNMIPLQDYVYVVSQTRYIGTYLFNVDYDLRIEDNIMILHNIIAMNTSRISCFDFVQAFVDGFYDPNIRGFWDGESPFEALLVCLRYLEEIVGELPCSSWLREQEVVLFSQIVPEPPETHVSNQLIASGIYLEEVNDQIICKSLNNEIKDIPLGPEDSIYRMIPLMRHRMSVKYQVVGERIENSYVPYILHEVDDYSFNEQSVPRGYSFDFNEYTRESFVEFMIKIAPDFLRYGVVVNGVRYRVSSRGAVESSPVTHSIAKPNALPLLVRAILEDRGILDRYGSFEWYDSSNILLERIDCIMREPAEVYVRGDCQLASLLISYLNKPDSGGTTKAICDRAKIFIDQDLCQISDFSPTMSYGSYRYKFDLSSLGSPRRIDYNQVIYNPSYNNEDLWFQPCPRMKKLLRLSILRCKIWEYFDQKD